LASVDELTLAAADRVALATVTGELSNLDHSICWVWFNPADNATIYQVRDFLAEFRTGQPVDLTGWTRATAIGVALAGYDEAEARQERYNRAAGPPASRHTAGSKTRCSATPTHSQAQSRRANSRRACRPPTRRGLPRRP
jgi:hypothetical protein